MITLAVRIVEAVLFAAEEPLDLATLQEHLPDGESAEAALALLERHYEGRGVRLERHGGRFALRTAPDLAPHLERLRARTRKLSRAALETLAIVAYHQPVTRAEIEQIRGVAVGRATIELLIEAGWIRPGGRRDTPGRPATWATTPAFLDHFALGALDELPGLEDLVGGPAPEAGGDPG
jgi:segregation and condensation protein B